MSLAGRLRAISEEAACSLWAYQIEEELPPLLIEGARQRRAVNYRGVKISPIYAEWLVSIAGELGHWVTQGSGEGYILYAPKSLHSKRPE